MTETHETHENPEGGNSQTPSENTFRCRKWCFTLNNYTDTETHDIKEYLSSSADKWIFGHEVGEEGTPHLQGYMEFKNAKKDNQLRQVGFARARLTKARGTLKNNYDYCSKESNFIYGGFRLDKLDYKVSLESLYQWEQDIINILQETPDARRVHWYWEPNGCSGKTTFQKHVFTNYKNVVVLSGKGTDMKNGIVKYVERNHEVPDIVLINIPRSVNQEYVSIEGLESIKDMFFFSGKYEGGMICGAPPHMFIFANEPPDESKLSADRWNIVRI